MFRQCTRCKVDEYSNKSLVLMVSECGHPLCKQCVEKIFAKHNGNCPQEGCGRDFKKSSYRVQTFDDPRIEKENAIRKRISKTFNLQEDDFPDLRSYNDYLERVEDIVCNLSNGIDTVETEAEIKKFKEENAETIERNRRRIRSEEERIKKIIEGEERQRMQRGQFIESEQPQEPLSNTNALIHELQASDLPAEVLLDRERKKKIELEMAEKDLALRRKQEKLERREKATFERVRATLEPYYHAIPVFSLNGPNPPSDLHEHCKFGAIKVGEAGMAGGYLPHIGVHRALLEGYQDLFLL